MFVRRETGFYKCSGKWLNLAGCGFRITNDLRYGVGGRESKIHSSGDGVNGSCAMG